ncbi:hypothetical protein AAF712_015935 [Marasmius tenuissimus]|uniref:Uncharacterized protein n=1 Tax=Marasmius tenuissimus TaxID=585030 RepID=A0ABR2Z9H7_9AGAR
MSLNNSVHAPHSASSRQGGGDNSNTVLNSLNSAPPEIPRHLKWTYIEYLGQTVHECDCSDCKSFLKHCSDSIGNHCIAYGEGIKQRNIIVARPYILQNEVLSATNSKLELELHEARRAQRTAERSYDRLNDEFKDMLLNYNKTQSDLESAQEELEHLREYSTDRKGKRRRTDGGESTLDDQPGAAANPMDVDDEGGPASTKPNFLPASSYTRDNPPWDDGLYRTGRQHEAARRNYEANLPVPKTDEQGRPLPKKWSPPRTADEVQALVDRLKRSEATPHPNSRLFDFLKTLFADAQKVPKEQRNPAHNAIIQLYYRPSFATKKNGKPNPVSGSTGTTSGPSGSTPGTPVNTGLSTTSNVPQPPKTADLAVYLLWLVDENSRATGNGRFGIRLIDGALCVRTARGIRFFYLRSPPSRRGASPMHRHQYQLVFIELVLTPGLYRSYIAAHPLPESPNALITSYSGDFANVNVQDLAEFFRAQSIPISDVEDAAYYAACWLSDASFKDIDSNIALNELRQKLVPQLISHGIPAGYDENIYQPDGTTVAVVSTVNFTIPGVPTTSTPVTSSSGVTTASPTVPDTTNDVSVESNIGSAPSGSSIAHSASNEGEDVTITDATPESATE